MSDFLFLGTGAADWNIEDKNAFHRREFRRNSAALLNGNLMIDCGKHIFDFAESINRPDLYDDITDIIITHGHCDHFSRESILKLAQNKKIRVGCCKGIASQIGEHKNITCTVFEPFRRYETNGYKITPILANHDVVVDGDTCSFHYIIETSDRKKIFYGLDGAWFLTPSWAEMKRHKFDLMVFDCTVGDMDDWRIFEHNTIPMLRFMISEVKRQQLLSDNGRLIASHFARTLHGSHDETELILKNIDMSAAFDGMKIII